jgi:hypothetical protein
MIRKSYLAVSFINGIVPDTKIFIALILVLIGSYLVTLKKAEEDKPLMAKI